MKYIPKRINHAGAVISVTLLVLSVVCFLGVSYWSFPKVVFQPIWFACLIAAIFVMSRAVLTRWEYGLSDSTEEYPCGKFQVYSLRGKRSVGYCDLDLSCALALIPESEDKALGDEGKRPIFSRTFSFVYNMFAKDVYYLYIRFQSTAVRLKLELGDETFLCALQSRILEAEKHPKSTSARYSLHNPKEEEEEGYYDPAEAYEDESEQALAETAQEVASVEMTPKEQDTQGTASQDDEQR